MKTFLDLIKLNSFFYELTSSDSFLAKNYNDLKIMFSVDDLKELSLSPSEDKVDGFQIIEILYLSALRIRVRMRIDGQRNTVDHSI